MATFLLLGCAGLPPNPGLERFTGYWTVGVTFSEFATSDGKHAFYVFEGDMPAAAGSFLNAQPSHYEASSESGSARSAYFEVLGRLYTGKDGYQRLHVEKVLQMRPADARYLASFGKRPSV